MEAPGQLPSLPMPKYGPAQHVLSMLVLTFAKTHSYSEWHGRSFYRRPLLGFISGIREKEEEVRDIIRPNDEIHTTHLSRLTHKT